MSHSLFRSGVIVAGFTFLSRILGFCRDVVFARVFAASAEMDAFLIAFKIPNFMRRLFAEGAFNQAFVPTIVEYKAKKDNQQVRDFLAHIAGTLGGYLLCITAIGMIAAPFLIMLFAPGYLSASDSGDSQYWLTVDLLRITFPYIFFISLVAFAGGILNTYGNFSIPAFTPVILNVVLIAAVIWLVPILSQPVMALAIGVFLAGLLQLLLQLPFLAKKGFLVRPRWNLKHEGVQKVLKLMLPAIFGASIAQINLLLDTIIASVLVTGSISWLYYSDRLMEFPLAILGVALATVILPQLSKNHAEKSAQEFSRTLDKALQITLLLGLPAAIGLCLLATPIITTLFASERFVESDILMSSYSLMAYSFGLLGFVFVKVLLPGFYSRQDTKTPVKIGVIALLVNMFFNLLIALPWHFSAQAGAHAGLAIATSISALVNAVLLYRGLVKEGVFCRRLSWKKLFLSVVLASFGMTIFLLDFNHTLNYWHELDSLSRIIDLLVQITGAIVIYFLLLRVSGLRLREYFHKH